MYRKCWLGNNLRGPKGGGKITIRTIIVKEVVSVGDRE